jgi:hypothetical protein
MRNFLLLLAICLSGAQLTFAKEWNGIKPLQTTRAEVIKLLGKPLPRDNKDLHTGEHFQFDQHSVYITWKRADCADQKLIDDSPSPNLPVKVYQITVVPPAPLALADVKKLNIPQQSPTSSGFTRAGPMHCSGSGGNWSCSMLYMETGFGYTTETSGGVIWLYYFPSEKEEQLWNEKILLCSGGKK